MSENAILWLFGAVASLLMVVVGWIITWIFNHAKDCRDFRVSNARHEGATDTEIKRIKEDIGDHSSGIRGWLHKLASDISPHIIRKQQTERKE